jgi:hypothetical protein
VHRVAYYSYRVEICCSCHLTLDLDGPLWLHLRSGRATLGSVRSACSVERWLGMWIMRWTETFIDHIRHRTAIFGRPYRPLVRESGCSFALIICAFLYDLLLVSDASLCEMQVIWLGCYFVISDDDDDDNNNNNNNNDIYLRADLQPNGQLRRHD